MTEVAMAITLNTLAIVIVAFLISNIVLSIASSLLAQKFLSLQVASRKILLWFDSTSFILIKLIFWAQLPIDFFVSKKTFMC